MTYSLKAVNDAASKTSGVVTRAPVFILAQLRTSTASVSSEKFTLFVGKTDFCLPGLVASSNRAIVILANVVPKVHQEALRLYIAAELKKAQVIQQDLATRLGYTESTNIQHQAHLPRMIRIRRCTSEKPIADSDHVNVEPKLEITSPGTDGSGKLALDPCSSRNDDRVSP
jgi:hypothetical protein